jgi:hypothetical protein
MMTWGKLGQERDENCFQVLSSEIMQVMGNLRQLDTKWIHLRADCIYFTNWC